METALTILGSVMLLAIALSLGTLAVMSWKAKRTR